MGESFTVEVEVSGCSEGYKLASITKTLEAHPFVRSAETKGDPGDWRERVRERHQDKDSMDDG